MKLRFLKDSGNTDPADWNAISQELILAPELDWEGINNDIGVSQGGEGTGVRQLRDPFVFEDNDGELYLFYTGAGEEAIGVASLTFNATAVPEPSGAIVLSALMSLVAIRRKRK